MKEQPIAAYRQQLHAMRQSLLDQIAAQRGGILGRTEVAQAHFSHPEDSRAQILSEKNVEFALGEREIAELDMIDAALARMDKGVYGQCADCGIDIPQARLHAAPEASRCMDCQEAFERSHRDTRPTP